MGDHGEWYEPKPKIKKGFRVKPSRSGKKRMQKARRK